MAFAGRAWGVLFIFLASKSHVSVCVCVCVWWWWWYMRRMPSFCIVTGLDNTSPRSRIRVFHLRTLYTIPTLLFSQGSGQVLIRAIYNIIIWHNHHDHHHRQRQSETRRDDTRQNKRDEPRLQIKRSLTWCQTAGSRAAGREYLVPGILRKKSWWTEPARIRVRMFYFLDRVEYNYRRRIFTFLCKACKKRRQHCRCKSWSAELRLWAGAEWELRYIISNLEVLDFWITATHSTNPLKRVH